MTKQSNLNIVPFTYVKMKTRELSESHQTGGYKCYACESVGGDIKALHKALKNELRTPELGSESGNLDFLADAMCGGFDGQKPNKSRIKIPSVQAFSPELIPGALRLWLADISHLTQTAPDFGMISALVIIGSIIGTGCGMRPKREKVIPNLWGCCIERPSVMQKLPSMIDVLTENTKSHPLLSHLERGSETRCSLNGSLPMQAKLATAWFEAIGTL
ncbi:MAG: hypothetical protein PSV18_06640 [Methylobacter sp.]|nr:hypothetical protein [Candidatus Methylobacter titanis]